MNGVAGSNRLRSRAAASLDTDQRDGGNVDEVLKRLGVLETLVAEIRAVLPQLATKAEVQTVRTEVQTVRTEVQTVRIEVQAVRTEVQAVRAELKADILSLETRIIKWFIGTAIAVAALAFTAAKFVS